VSHTAWLIEYRNGAYRWARACADGQLTDMPPTQPNDAAALAEALADAGYAGEPVLLAIPSGWCLSGSVALASRRLARNRQAVAYALEEYLPLSAEEMVFDFMAPDTLAFAVAAEIAALLPVITSLEEAGLAVTTITPIAMLLLAHLAHTQQLPRTGVAALVDSHGCDWVLLAGARPQQWRCLPPDNAALARELAAELLARNEDGPLPVTVIGLNGPAALSVPQFDPDLELTITEVGRDEVFLAAADDVMSRGRRPWIELRRGQLGQYDPYRALRGSWYALLATLLFAMTCLSAVAWIRAGMCRELAATVDNQKRELFRQLFPGSRVPTGVLLRLESEQRKLAGTSRDNVPAPQLLGVTGYLLDMLDALPAELRLRLLDIQCAESTAYVEGEARQFGDVDTIAAALRERGFLVDPPSTERLAGEGVSFTLSITAFPPPAAHE